MQEEILINSVNNQGKRETGEGFGMRAVNGGKAGNGI